MDSADSHWLQLVKDNLLIILLAASGVVFLGYGAFQIVMPKSEGIVIEKAESASQETERTKGEEIVVDVEGAVENPGIYRLSIDARQQDALIAAGGMSKSADRPLVAKTLNMAAKLSDGMKIYIPRMGEVPAPVVNTAGQVVAGTSTSTGISINSASASELDSLPGVGPVTSDKIIKNRPYSSLEELTSKKAVTKATFEKIKDQISL